MVEVEAVTIRRCQFGAAIFERGTPRPLPCEDAATQVLILTDLPEGSDDELWLCYRHLLYIDQRIPGGLSRYRMEGPPES